MNKMNYLGKLLDRIKDYIREHRRRPESEANKSLQDITDCFSENKKQPRTGLNYQIGDFLDEPTDIRRLGHITNPQPVSTGGFSTEKTTLVTPGFTREKKEITSDPYWDYNSMEYVPDNCSGQGDVICNQKETQKLPFGLRLNEGYSYNLPGSLKGTDLSLGAKTELGNNNMFSNYVAPKPKLNYQPENIPDAKTRAAVKSVNDRMDLKSQFQKGQAIYGLHSRDNLKTLVDQEISKLKKEVDMHAGAGYKATETTQKTSGQPGDNGPYTPSKTSRH